MADQVQIDPDLLFPGDIIRFDYLIRNANETLIDYAISDLKQTIADDGRLDYQGSEITNPVDLETGTSSRILSIYAEVRRYRRERPEESLQAGVSAKAIVALVAAAVLARSAYLAYRTYSVTRIAMSPAVSDEVKKAAIDALQGKTIGETLTQWGLSVPMLVVMAAVAYFAFGVGRSK